MKPILFMITFMALLGLLSLPASAQQTYYTRPGILLVKAIDGDSLATHKFKNINVMLDYEKAEVTIKFKLAISIEENIPSKHFLYDYDVAINSKLSLAKIETQYHPDLDFSFRGNLTFGDTAYHITGNGVLQHLKGSEGMSCMLRMDMKLMEGTTLVFKQYGEVKDIFLLQTVLNKNVLDEWEGF